MYASEAILSLEVVNISLMQLSACTCGRRLSSMFALRASTSVSAVRSFIARGKRLPLVCGSAANRADMAAGIPADLRVMASDLS